MTLLFIVIFAVSVALTRRSYWVSDSVTYSDVTIATDEGLVSFYVPLIRIAHNHDATTKWRTYEYERRNLSGTISTSWTTNSGDRKLSLHDNVSMLVDVDLDEAASAWRSWGFGYVYLGWSSESRPGPSLQVFAPIWAITAFGAIMFSVFLARRTKFGLRSLVFFTTAIAVLLWLPTLHAPT